MNFFSVKLFPTNFVYGRSGLSFSLGFSLIEQLIEKRKEKKENEDDNAFVVAVECQDVQRNDNHKPYHQPDSDSGLFVLGIYRRKCFSIDSVAYLGLCVFGNKSDMQRYNTIQSQDETEPIINTTMKAYTTKHIIAIIMTLVISGGVLLIRNAQSRQKGS